MFGSAFRHRKPPKKEKQGRESGSGGMSSKPSSEQRDRDSSAGRSFAESVHNSMRGNNNGPSVSPSAREKGKRDPGDENILVAKQMLERTDEES
jgi:hypothetical protein